MRAREKERQRSGKKPITQVKVSSNALPRRNRYYYLVWLKRRHCKGEVLELSAAPAYACQLGDVIGGCNRRSIVAKPDLR